MIDYQKVLPVITSAVEIARRNPMTEGNPLPDACVAWVVCQELHRAGWTIVPAEPPGQG
jgi:hypothetical protein